MNKKKRILVIIIAVLSVVLLAEVVSVLFFEKNDSARNETTPAEITEMEETAQTNAMTDASDYQLIDQEQDMLEQLYQRIDDGDCVGFAELLLNGEGNEKLFALLVQEDPEMVEYLVLDAMLTFAWEGKYEHLVMLRKNGFVSDNCFLNYWEVMGSVLPEVNLTDVDPYLIHELKLTYERDHYALRSFVQMRSAGMIDDAMHDALINELGFDYTDEGYVEQNNLSPLQKLNAEEKLVYENVLEYIDQGDCMGVVDGMLYGKVTLRVYECLLENDAEVAEYMLAQGMAELVEWGRFSDLVRLRLEGFVSDSCFECYWEKMDEEKPGEGYVNEAYPGVDMYLLYELVQTYFREEEGSVILNELWNSGLLNDAIHEALVAELGFDYTELT